MAFWGVEVKPSKPYSHSFDAARGRLRISQATLGNGTSLKKSIVQCNVEDKTSVLICCLLPDKAESCSLDLQFQEEDKVTFSVLGPRSVHLAGYYLHTSPNNDHDSDSYGEDIGDTESEHSTDIHSEDEYEDDFIDDTDRQAFSPSPVPKNRAVVREVSKDEGQTERKGNRKRLKKRYQVSDSDGDNRNANIIGGGSSIFVSDSEDEDALPISTLPKTKVESAEVHEKPDATTVKNNKEKHEHGVDHVTGSKRKSQGVQDNETERAFENTKFVSRPSSEVGKENNEKRKKKRKKDKSEGRESRGVGNDSVIHVQQDKAQIEETITDDCREEHINNEKPSLSLEPDANHVDEGTTENKRKRKKKKKKTSECDQIVNVEETVTDIVKRKDERAAGKKIYERNGMHQLFGVCGAVKERKARKACGGSSY